MLSSPSLHALRLSAGQRLAQSVQFKTSNSVYQRNNVLEWDLNKPWEGGLLNKVDNFWGPQPRSLGDVFSIPCLVLRSYVIICFYHLISRTIFAVRF